MIVARALETLESATGDFVALETLVPSASPDFTACYHAQQVVEKSLKAVILQYGLLQERSVRFRDHNLGNLMKVLMDAGVVVPPTVARTVVLTPCGTRLRYGAPSLPLPVPRRSLVSMVGAVLDWAEDQVEVG